jgi:hypothetical protein
MKKIIVLGLTLAMTWTGVFAQEKAGKKDTTPACNHYIPTHVLCIPIL